MTYASYSVPTVDSEPPYRHRRILGALEVVTGGAWNWNLRDPSVWLQDVSPRWWYHIQWRIYHLASALAFYLTGGRRVSHHDVMGMRIRRTVFARADHLVWMLCPAYTFLIHYND